MESYKHLIKTFGEQLGVKGIHADDQGYVALSFDNQILHLQYDSQLEEIIVFTQLGEIEPDRLSDICLMFLSANLFWQGTQGATFSVEPATRMMFLAERKAICLIEIDQLNNWLENFLNIAIYWCQQLKIANAGDSLKFKLTEFKGTFNPNNLM